VFLPIANPDTNQHAADENVNRRTRPRRILAKDCD
jgi:hypothetical protein